MSTSTRSAPDPLEGVLAAAADCAAIADVQVIAFPQEGLLRDPGTYELMARAMETGATSSVACRIGKAARNCNANTY